VDEDLEICRAEEGIQRYRKGTGRIVVLNGGEPVEGATVSIEQTGHEFLFGCNIYMFDRFETAGDNETYKVRFEELFNYATTGFYWRSYETRRGEPKYDYTQSVVDWCRERGIRLKGHPLLWDHEASLPGWSGGSQPAPEVRERRVREIMRRFGSGIEFWEVVNEPSHCRNIKIDDPYRWARNQDPGAYLIVNDYHVLADGHPPFYRLLEEAIENGVPFDGIGIQAHEPRTMRFPLHKVRVYLDTYSSLGKDLHITEFTPTSGGQEILDSDGKWDEDAQADYAEKFYKVCFSHPNVVAITWWDLCDRGSWLEGGGLLRKDLSPKPAYERLKELIWGEWQTNVEGKTDEDGRFEFDGFYGKYDVCIAIDGSLIQGRLDLSKNSESPSIIIDLGKT
jgi:GH35 family endo-1,4-beta-xylanase